MTHNGASPMVVVVLLLLLAALAPQAEAGRRRGRGKCTLTHGMKRAQCNKKALGCGWRWVGTCNNVGGIPGFGGCQKIGNCGAMKCPSTCKALGCTWSSTTGSCSATCDAVCAANAWDGLVSTVPLFNSVASDCTFTNLTTGSTGYVGAVSGVVILPDTGLHSYKFKAGAGFTASPPVTFQPHASIIYQGTVMPIEPSSLPPYYATTGDIFEFVINTTYTATPSGYGITLHINGALQGASYIPAPGAVDGLRFAFSGGPAALPLSVEEVC